MSLIAPRNSLKLYLNLFYIDSYESIVLKKYLINNFYPYYN